MYIPRHFAVSRLDALHGLIRRFPLGTLISGSHADLQANHIPFLVTPADGPHGTLCAHVARNNPVWRGLLQQPGCLVVFQGPQSYISPAWYASKKTHGKVVPTWNYVAVHAYGAAEVIEDQAWLRAHVAGLTRIHEAGQPRPWRLDDAPAEFIDRMLESIVGLTIRVERIEGKWKTSQNRPRDDRAGVAAALREQAGPAMTMAELVESSLQPNNTEPDG